MHDLLTLEAASLTPPTDAHTDLVGAAREAAERWSRAAEQRAIAITVDASAEVAARTASEDVAQILDNLIENSLRYAASPGEVTIRALDIGGRPGLRVSDSGPGIEPADRVRVFERFYRGTAGRQSGPGTGLGLAIVGELVRRWSGEVAIVDGPGSDFEIRFERPAAPKQDGQARPHKRGQRPRRAGPYRFLTEGEPRAGVTTDRVEP